MRVKRLALLTATTGILSIGACVNDTHVQPAAETGSGLVRPSYFPAAHYTFDKNVYSKEGFELGRKLFYDPMLSVDNTISCASCHKQEYAFADGGNALSIGINGLRGRRNSPAIFNMAWNTSFMWDGGVNHIEVMPLAPLTNRAEMGETINHIIEKLNNDKEYPTLFKNVFKREPIDAQQMFYALAQFMGNLVSAGSKYDKFVTGKEVLTNDENDGYYLYKKNCASCHTEPLFTSYSFENNGLDTVYTSDSGRYRIALNPDDWGKFKVPSLRNVAVTGPYMHDGRFKTLEDVLAHYTDGVLQTATLSPLLVKNGKPGLALTEEEQRKIIAFLHTLTDYELINNPAYRE